MEGKKSKNKSQPILFGEFKTLGIQNLPLVTYSVPGIQGNNKYCLCNEEKKLVREKKAIAISVVWVIMERGVVRCWIVEGPVDPQGLLLGPGLGTIRELRLNSRHQVLKG